MEGLAGESETYGEAATILANWDHEMAAADDAGKKAASSRLAETWLAGGPFTDLAKDKSCPMAYEVDRITAIMDTEDDNARRARASAMSRLQVGHPGSPPRAMSLNDKPHWSDAVVFKRGNPAMRGDAFERAWPDFLGGGVFPKDKSARLSLAEKIADLKNPLTARVMVNRVWAWNFGAPLADPSDFGVQQAEPPLRPLLDYLAVWFTDHGGSVKELNRLLLTSQAFRLAADGPAENNARDEANTRFWKWNRHRLDFETMRDHLLATAGSLDTRATGGRSMKIDDSGSDARRSVYAFIDRYALPGVFVSFDLPHPDHLSAARGQTTVPQQALYFLNSPLLLRRSAALASDSAFKGLPDDTARVAWLYRRLYQRDPSQAETQTILQWLAGTSPADYRPKLGGTWEIRHADDSPNLPLDAREFPLFANDVWKTGPDPATAPIRWLNAGASGGHVSAGHAMILRWRANGSGEVKMTGHLKRTQKEGNVLAWRIDGKGRDILAGAKFPPETETNVASPWVSVKEGDTLDLVLLAPEGDSCGGIAWTLKIMGRETPGAKAVEIGNLNRQFPRPGTAPEAVIVQDPWADVIQMLWSSNEFNFID